MDQIFPKNGATPGFTEGFGRRFSSLIDLIGTLKEASQIAGCTSEQIAKWRDGRARPSLYAVTALAAAAGVSLDWLATGEGHMRKWEGRQDAAEKLLDGDLLADVIGEVERFVDERGCVWSRAKRARLAALGYAMMRERGANDVAMKIAEIRYLLEAACD